MPGTNVGKCSRRSLSSHGLKNWVERPGVVAYACILALWEAEIGRSWGQEMETILSNMVNPISTKNTKTIVMVHACNPSYSGG